jgi:hypothetical protein
MATPGEDVLMKRAILLLAAVLVVATACGGTSESTSSTPAGETGSTSAQQAVLQAAAKGAELKSAHLSLTATMRGGAVNGTFTGDGAFAGKKARMSMDLSDLGGGVIQGRMDMVFANLVVYMRFPAELAQELPPGKQWIKFDLAKLGTTQGIDLAALFDQFSGSDPSRSLELLRAADPDFRAIGSETVRGVQTTHYRGTVDLERLAASAPANLRDTYRRVIQLSGQKTVPVDAWIDDQGRTRRVRYEQHMQGGSTMELTEEFYDFGAPVNVSPPPADEVIDVTQLIGNA